MNRDAITIEDCINMYDKKNKTVILAAGHVVKFVKREKDCQRGDGFWDSNDQRYYR